MEGVENIPAELVDCVAEKFRLRGDSTRLAILRALKEVEKSVGRVVEVTGGGQADISKHLELLHEAGLVSRRKEGLQVFYRASDPLAGELCGLVCDIILQETREQVAQGRRLRRNADGRS